MRTRMEVKTLMSRCTFSLTYAQERRKVCWFVDKEKPLGGDAKRNGNGI